MQGDECVAVWEREGACRCVCWRLNAAGCGLGQSSCSHKWGKRGRSTPKHRRARACFRTDSTHALLACEVPMHHCTPSHPQPHPLRHRALLRQLLPRMLGADPSKQAAAGGGSSGGAFAGVCWAAYQAVLWLHGSLTGSTTDAPPCNERLLVWTQTHARHMSTVCPDFKRPSYKH